MKHPKALQVVAVALALFVAATAMAAQTGKASVTVFETVTINGSTVAPGEYLVKWEGTAPVKVTIMQGKKVVATASATVQPRNATYNETALITAKKGGQTTVVEIRPEGKKEALVLDATPAQ